MILVSDPVSLAAESRRTDLSPFLRSVLSCLLRETDPWPQGISVLG
jgi:hypothetical protein